VSLLIFTRYQNMCELSEDQDGMETAIAILFRSWGILKQLNCWYIMIHMHFNSFISVMFTYYSDETTDEVVDFSVSIVVEVVKEMSQKLHTYVRHNAQGEPTERVSYFRHHTCCTAATHPSTYKEYKDRIVKLMAPTKLR
jgi:hypothetical protein